MSNRYVVRYGATRSLGVFTNSRGESLRRGDRIVARTERGLETGEVLTEASDEAVAKIADPRRGQVLRTMSAEDRREAERLKEQERREFAACKAHVAALRLPMELVDVEHLFGGERIVIYYLSENRVDFRELVKVLAAEFQTRIEMRQIGVRDEAKLLADYGDCGKPVCCNTHLSEMPPVSMKMAKVQKATLDPTKISGRCGRLKCCLRYEYDTYEDLQRELPPVGAEAQTRDGRVRILAQEILAGQLLVETEDRRRILIAASDVLSVTQPARRPPSESRGGGEGRGGDDRPRRETSGDAPRRAAPEKSMPDETTADEAPAETNSPGAAAVPPANVEPPASDAPPAGD